VCRAGQYQKRRVRQAARLHVLRCVLRAQALFRGRIARKALFALRKAHYMPDVAADTAQTGPAPASGGASMSATAAPLLRPVAVDESRKAAFVASALGDLHRRLHAAGSKRESHIDALFDNLDRCAA
jgi:hypothetical protein